jgi:hypothetical protein
MIRETDEHKHHFQKENFRNLNLKIESVINILTQYSIFIKCVICDGLLRLCLEENVVCKDSLCKQTDKHIISTCLQIKTTHPNDQYLSTDYVR